MTLRILAVLMGLAAAGLIGVLWWTRDNSWEEDESDGIDEMQDAFDAAMDENGWAAA